MLRSRVESLQSQQKFIKAGLRTNLGVLNITHIDLSPPRFGIPNEFRKSPRIGRRFHGVVCLGDLGVAVCPRGKASPRLFKRRLGILPSKGPIFSLVC
jgi:hypothetical protein